MSSLKELIDHVAKQIPPEDLKVLQIASEHPHECKCNLCKRWWELCGEEKE